RFATNCEVAGEVRVKVDVSVATMAEVVRLHELAYTLLMWLDSRGRDDPDFLAALGPEIQDRSRAAAWLREAWPALPFGERPRPSDEVLARLAGLLASFFEVSFVLSVDRGLDGSVRAAKILNRSSSKRRIRKGRIEVEALQRLAIDAGVRPSREDLHAWRSRIADEDVEAWVYGVELVCRSEGRSQGVPALRLWRRLPPDDRDALLGTIERARQRLLAALREAP
ncbi:MAG: hypothetical protein AAF602_26120, partial [Myxococcota bacterium]